MGKFLWRQGGFGKGMVLDRPDVDLEPGESPYMLNMFWRNGKLRNIPEMTAFRNRVQHTDLAVDAANVPNGSIAVIKYMGNYTPAYAGSTVDLNTLWVCSAYSETSSAYRTYVLQFGASALAVGVRYLDLRTGCISGAGGAGTTAAVTGMGYAMAAAYGRIAGGNAIVTSNFGTGCRSWVIGAAATALISAGHFPRIAYHQNYWWFTVSTNEATLCVDGPDVFAAATYSYAIGNPNEKITALVPAGDNALLVFKEFSIWIVRNTPGTSIRIELLTDKLGCVHAGTICHAWDSRIIMFLGSDFRMKILNGPQIVDAPTRIPPDLIRSLCDAGTTTDEYPLERLELYGATNHYGHYILLPQMNYRDCWKLQEVTYTKKPMGLLFDMQREWWCSWFDACTAASSGYNRLITSSVMMARGDIAADGSNQFIPVKTPVQFGFNNLTTASIPDVLLDDPDNSHRADSDWAVRTRPVSLPSRTPFKISAGSLRAAIQKERTFVKITEFDKYSEWGIGGIGFSYGGPYKDLTFSRRDRFSLAWCHFPGSSYIYRTFSGSGVDLSGATGGFEIFVTLYPDERQGLPNPAIVRFSLMLTDSAAKTWTETTAYGICPTLGRQRLTFGVPTGITQTAITEVRFTVQGTTYINVGVDGLKGLVAKTIYEREADLGVIEAAYQIGSPVRWRSKSTCQDRILTFHPRIYLADFGTIIDAVHTKLPPVTKISLESLQASLRNHPRYTATGVTCHHDVIAIEDVEFELSTEKFVAPAAKPE